MRHFIQVTIMVSTSRVDRGDINGHMNVAALFAFTIGIFGALFMGLISCCLKLGWDPVILHLGYIFCLLWYLPTTLYLVYHRLTLPLPTWLTLGYPIAFGGIRPAICTESNNGNWECLRYDLEAWLASFSELENSDQFLKPELSILMFLFFVAANLVWLKLVFDALRYDPQRDATRKDEKRRSQEADARILELSDNEKQ